MFRRPDGSWVGIANLGAGASLRVEARQVGIAIERLTRQLPSGAPAPKRICLRCRMLIDPVAMSYHVSRKEHREQEDPWAQPLPSAPVAAPSPTAEPPASASPPDERFAVGMEPMLISVADAARVLGLSTSTIGSLAAKGTIPSLRIGKRVLLPVRALEEWIEGAARRGCRPISRVVEQHPSVCDASSRRKEGTRLPRPQVVVRRARPPRRIIKWQDGARARSGPNRQRLRRSRS